MINQLETKPISTPILIIGTGDTLPSAIREIIDRCRDKALRCEDLTRDELVALISIDPENADCDYLGETARNVKRHFSGDVTRLGTSIGLDLRPCRMSCDFCSLGEKVGLITKEYEISDDTAVQLIADLRKRGFYQFTLRTTEFYPIERLANLARRIRSELGWEFALSGNTGELTPEKAKMLKDVGINAIYHAVRLREGIDTPLSVETRSETIRNAKAAGLRVSSGIDPIGVDHTAEEIADLFLHYYTLDVDGMCIMRRVNVPGTRFEGMPEVSDRRLAQIVAVARLACGNRWTIAIHPAVEQGLVWGADHISVETGANPRDNNIDMLRWSLFDHDTALRMMEHAGCVFGYNPFLSKKQDADTQHVKDHLLA